MKLITLVASEKEDWVTRGQGWEGDLTACPFVPFQFQTIEYITYSKVNK